MEVLHKLDGWLSAGGPIVWLLALLALLALTLFFVKLIQFRRAGVGRGRRVAELLSTGAARQSAMRQFDRIESWQDPVSRAVATAVRGLRNGFSEDVIREEVTRVANLDLQQLRSHLRTLGFISTVSPLLGLLGTVIGMIAAFQGIEAAGQQVDPTVLSGGIWQALLTTAVGLAVAIPVSMAHAWLERRIDRVADQIENLVMLVFTNGLQQPGVATDPA